MKKTIDNYSIRQTLGQGVYGQVYRAVNIKNNQEVAIKTIPVKKFHEIPKLQEFTVNEIRILSQINKQCPYIVKYIDMLKTVNNFYFVYEYCNGGTLAKMIKNQGKINEKKVLLIIKQMFQAFKVMSKKNIMHRDLKPENILFHNGSVRLADFGFCKLLGSKDDLAQTMLGSPLYMAPQVLKGQIYTIKADIWSFGVVVFQMIYGKCPFQSKTIASLIKYFQNQDVAFPITPKIAPALQDLMKRCLIKNFQQRISWDQIFSTYHITQQGEIINKNDIVAPFVGGDVRSSLRQTAGLMQRQTNFNQNYNPSYRNTINYSIGSPQINITSPKSPNIQMENNFSQPSFNNTHKFYHPTPTLNPNLNDSRNAVLTARSPAKYTNTDPNSPNTYQNTGQNQTKSTARHYSQIQEVQGPRSGQNSNKSSDILGHIKKSGTSQKTQSSHNIDAQIGGPVDKIIEEHPTSALLHTNKLQNTRLDIIIKNHQKITQINSILVQVNERNHKYSDNLCFYMLKSIGKQIQQLSYKIQQNKSLQNYHDMKTLIQAETGFVHQLMEDIQQILLVQQTQNNNQSKSLENMENIMMKNRKNILKDYIDSLPDNQDDIRVASQVIDYLLEGFLIKKDAYERMSKQHLLKQMKAKISKQNV